MIYSFIYLKNPYIFLKIAFKSEIEIIMKNDEKIKIQGKQFPFYIEIFQKGWKYEKNYWYNKNIKLKLNEPLVLKENFKKIYSISNLKNQNVLDIGGLNGESSLYFVTEEKVNNVFVYEPVKENFILIHENLDNNSIKNKVIAYNIGVSNKNGFEILNSEFPPGSWGFGLPGDKYKIKINVESWDTILERHKKDNIYLAKVDCEGGERYLVEANKELIKTISNRVIETHSAEIEKNIIGLFESLGYKKELKEEVNKKERVNMWYFYL